MVRQQCRIYRALFGVQFSISQRFRCLERMRGSKSQIAGNSPQSASESKKYDVL